MRIAVLFTLLVLLMGSADAVAQRELNADRSTMFSGSGNCQLCHTAGTGANTSSAGEDVSPPTGWRSSMMAGAARDPFWQAVVVAEVMDNPHLAAVIEDKCTNCHTPMGHEEAHAGGATTYSLADARGDALAMDAVSCTLCHQVTEDNFGTPESFSGGYEIASTRVTYGPYENPLIQPMRNLSGFEPVHSRHIEQAELCATCHTLFTPFLDSQGQIAGEFPEQTPYLEWKASSYPGQGLGCQNCHMPKRDEAMRISTIPQTAPQRQPVYEHHFVGGNSFMLGVMQANANEIGATAYDVHFDSSIARTLTQLKERSVTLSSGGAFVRGDELAFTVEVRNRTGHKFPTAFPSRRAWLHVRVTDADQKLVFESGEWDSRGVIADEDAPYEPHHGTIRSADDVQIWESIMGDVDGAVTVRLLRGAQYLKDNRIPPLGFTASAMASDTIGCVGVQDDADFNAFDGVTNSGRDDVHYAIAIDPSWSPPFDVHVELCYQSIRPAFIDNLGRHDAPETRRMIQYYDAAPRRAEVVQSLRLESQEVNALRPADALPGLLSLSLYPQPVSRSTGMLRVDYELAAASSGGGTLAVFSILGQEMLRVALPAGGPGRIARQVDISALRPGMYFISVVAGDERGFVPLRIAP